MKLSMLCAVAAGGLLLVGNPLFAQTGTKIMVRDLPDAVKKTVRAQQGHQDVKRIEKLTRDGKTIYEVRIDRKKGVDKVVFIGEDGSLVTDTALTSSQNGSRANLQLKDVPQAVQQTYRREARNAPIRDIDVNSSSGKNVYEIEYSQGGRVNELLINEDGSLNHERLSRSASANDSSSSSSSASSSSTSGQAGFDRPLASTQKMDFEGLPQAVKQTARDRAGSNRIEDVERGTLDGRTIYEIAFKSEGKHHELRVADDGSVVQEIAGTNIRFPGALSVNEVPEPVRRAIQNQVGSGEVNDIDKKSIDGKTVYEVGFKREKGGTQHELRIAEDGTVLGEAAGAENK